MASSALEANVLREAEEDSTSSSQSVSRIMNVVKIFYTIVADASDPAV